MKSKSLSLALLVGTLLFGVPNASSQQTNNQQNDTLVAARKQLQECQGTYRSGAPDAAARALVKALDAQDLFVKAGAKDGQAFSLTWVAMLYAELGNRPKAIEAYDKAATLFHELGDGRNEAEMLSSLGYACVLDGQAEKGFSALNEALALYRKLGDKLGESKTLGSFALAYEHVGDVGKALSYYDQALAQSHAVGDTRGEATVQFLSAGLLWRSKDPMKAIERFQSALIAYRSLNDKKWQAITQVTIGRVYDSQGDLGKALENYLQALPLVHGSVDNDAESGFLKRIAELYERMGDSSKASEFYARSASVQQYNKDKEAESSQVQPGASPTKAPAATDKSSQLPQISPPSGRQQQLAVARQFLLEGIALYSQGTEESLRGALEKAVTAQRLFHQAGDGSGEAFTLFGIGWIYDVFGEYTKALDYFQQAQVLRHKASDKRGEALTLNNLGVIYGQLGDLTKQLSCYEQSLSLFRATDEKIGQAYALSNIGSVLHRQGDVDKALSYHQQALVLWQSAADRSGQALALADIGYVFSALGEKGKALEYLLKSLSQYRQPPAGMNGSINAEELLGSKYDALSEQEKQLAFFRLSFALGPLVEDKQTEASILDGIGFIYRDLGESGRSLDFFQQALALYRKVGDRDGIALTLDGIGRAYGNWGEPLKAIEYANQALSTFRASRDKGGEAMELGNIGQWYSAAGNRQKALEYCQQSLLLSDELGDKRGIAISLSNLMWLSRESNDLGQAIFYGKQSVNVYQALRLKIRNIDRALQQSFAKSVEGTYRLLADLLITDGRLPEAQQVLDLLKEQEYFDFVRRDASEGSSLNAKATLTPEEAALEKRYHEIADRFTALAAERAELFNKVNRTPEEEKRLAQLDKDIIDGNKVFQQFLSQLTQDLTRPKQLARVGEIEESEGLMDTLRRLGPGTVALYTLVSDERYRVILVTADVRKAYEYSIKSADLNRKVLAFREALQTPSRDPRPLAREMYDILIGPDLARDLAQAKAQTLMWSLDGVLRYLPMAALYDGQRYLVENYRNSVFTPASHSRLNNPVNTNWRGLGLGVSKPQEGFVGLIGVPEELRGIIRDESSKTGVLPGKLMLDEAFTEKSMESALRQSYPVVHIASHFRFQPGNETQSFLLLGDGTHLTLAELKSMGQLFSGVDLLTLSACNTAVGDRLGDGKEVESFGVIAQKKGASAVMASLWPVMDESTQLFMREFYSLHGSKRNITKGDALREAQLALLRGQIRGSEPNALARNISRGAGNITGQPRFETDPKAPFAHPYFWAPFILIGNWK